MIAYERDVLKDVTWQPETGNQFSSPPHSSPVSPSANSAPCDLNHAARLSG
jgi:hypothetical protein